MPDAEIAPSPETPVGRSAAPDARPIALVLSGGNALGAYQAGAWQAFAASGREADWLAGASVGAINAAIIAGSPPEQRVDRLRAFWDRASLPADPLGLAAGPLQRPAQLLSAMTARLLGRPNVFRLSLPGLLSFLPGMPDRTAIYDLGPLRDSLAGLIDLDRLNAGSPRLSVLAVDVETGEEVVFDTARERLGLDHIIASASLIPDFPATEIGGRFLVDGGLAANAPAHIVLGDPGVPDDPGGRERLCIVVDLFPCRESKPRSWMESSERQTDLVFALQTRRTLAAHAREAATRGRLRALLALLPAEQRARPEIAQFAAGLPDTEIKVLTLAYTTDRDETVMKSFDFSRSAITRRWAKGEREMGELLRVRAARRDQASDG